MSDVFKKLGIEFDDSNQATISKAKLQAILQRADHCHVFSLADILTGDYYLLIDSVSRDFYPVPADHLEQWEKDGSCEPGDSLFKMTFIKRY